jgi:hypothetical protein
VIAKITSPPVANLGLPPMFCVKAISHQLQNLDWQMPPRFNTGRITSAFGVRPARFHRFPHPIA